MEQIKPLEDQKEALEFFEKREAYHEEARICYEMIKECVAPSNAVADAESDSLNFHCSSISHKLPVHTLTSVCNCVCVCMCVCVCVCSDSGLYDCNKELFIKKTTKRFARSLECCVGPPHAH